ncbi:hypothetical protein D9756_001501 [Leucocoprinus leucothites]|uniref:Condensation domain-containing protein n=1 Tax=Leucocoprinus leucothites TaxID=201217 RepID=A0A8H5G4T1_9AGAR|nr:hypothetical protein D9756_001501 [Leucoagaricus leucothites]
MLSSPWTFEQPSTYVRPLGLTEQIFYWDGLFEGTADSVVSAEIELRRLDLESTISPANIQRAWISLKAEFPLLGSRIVKRPDQSLWFAVDGDRLRACGPGELHFHDVVSAEEAQTISSNIPNSARLLSTDLLACLLIFRRTDDLKRFHVLIHAAHAITDGIANATLLRTFLDKLSSANSGVETWNIRDRLALSSSCDDLNPFHRLSAAQKRWRLAIGAVVWHNRVSRLRGGHTLPCHVSNATTYQPAGSGNIQTTFTKEETQGVIQGCRQLGMTFGSVYPIAGQVALTRLLCRKYVLGEISEEEWEFRKREPMITAGPLNLRPFLDREWYNKGGATNASLAIGFYFYHLPYMPLGSASNIKYGSPVPSYDELLSRRRFAHRCVLVKKEADRVLRSPLQYEIGVARFPARIAGGKEVAENWKHKLLLNSPSDRRPWSAQEMATKGLVLGHGGSSFGNTDGLYPEFYPLSGSKPVLRHVSTSVGLHTRPRELYLGAASGRGQLRINVYYDTKVYDADLVKEWLAEVKAAIQHYLFPRNFTSSRL